MSKKSDDDNDFRLRPARPRARSGEANAWSKALSTVLTYARASKRADGRSGAPRQLSTHNQRCAVRVMYSPNQIAGQWRSHGRYIARDSASGDHQTAGFGADGEQVAPAESLARWQSAGDPRLWKLIISPEFAERVDLMELTRATMARMERDFGTTLEWVAVAHFNTEHPHVHVALRGIRGDGSELKLPREYVRSGIRHHAERACTLQLGYRTSMDAAEARRREIGARRFTSLDRAIVGSSLAEHPREDARRFVLSGLGAQSQLAARLRSLKAMGLAEEGSGGDWLIRRDLEAVLRSMQQVADRQKVLARQGALLSDPRLPMEVLDMRKLKTVEGRVLLHSEDEQTGRAYMLLEGTDAKVYVVHHTAEIIEARGQGKMRANAFVRLRRLFENGRPVLEVADRGDADKLLRDRTFLRERAQEVRGREHRHESWGGWLGRYNRILASVEEKPVSRHPRER